jgi:predicted Zn-dependent protease
MARSRPESAVVAFRQAITSETQGFSRLELDLARALMQLGRAKEAIPVLQHPLRGALEGGNFYATRTELQEELAHAFDAAGERDSAAVYYRTVIQAWHAADPRFQPRVAAARARLSADVQTFAGGR